MEPRYKLQKLVEKAEQEFRIWESEFIAQRREKEGYLKALKDALKILPLQGEVSSEESSLRKGSMPYKVFKFLEREGAPRHVSQILIGIGEENSMENRKTFTSVINGYVRREHLFSRPEPNTFGLLSFGRNQSIREGNNDSSMFS